MTNRPDEFDDVQDEEFEDGLLDQEDEQEEDGSSTEATSDKRFTQEDLEAKIRELTWRERSRVEKKIAKLFGTTDLNQAAEYFRAGYAVSQASGKSPAEVLQRLAAQVNPQGQATPQGELDVRREIQEIKDILADQREQDIRSAQAAEAKKEYGALFEENRDDIEDLADERGLSLMDAAAIVLRPKLKEIYEKRALAKQLNKRKARVEGSEEPPNKGADPAGQLSAEQKRVAQKAGISFKDYYAQLKALGRI